MAVQKPIYFSNSAFASLDPSTDVLEASLGVIAVIQPVSERTPSGGEPSVPPDGQYWRMPGLVLPDGRVGYERYGGLAGGLVSLYDPVAESWAVVPYPPHPTDPVGFPEGLRTRYAGSIVLADGRILIAGGLDVDTGTQESTTFCHIYDPASQAWTRAADLPDPREQFMLFRLADGKILAVAGYKQVAGVYTTYASCVVYDPVADAWTATGTLPSPRALYRAIALPDGRILLTGGQTAREDFNSFVAECHLYTPATGVWTAAPSLPTPLEGNELAVSNGVVYSVGGYGLRLDGGTASLDYLFRWVIDAPAWTTGPSFPHIQSDGEATLAALPDGRVVVFASTWGVWTFLEEGWHALVLDLPGNLGVVLPLPDGSWLGVWGNLAHLYSFSAYAINQRSRFVNGTQPMITVDPDLPLKVFFTDPVGGVDKPLASFALDSFSADGVRLWANGKIDAGSLVLHDWSTGSVVSETTVGPNQFRFDMTTPDRYKAGVDLSLQEGAGEGQVNSTWYTADGYFEVILNGDTSVDEVSLQDGPTRRWVAHRDLTSLWTGVLDGDAGAYLTAASTTADLFVEWTGLLNSSAKLSAADNDATLRLDAFSGFHVFVSEAPAEVLIDAYTGTNSLWVELLDDVPISIETLYGFVFENQEQLATLDSPHTKWSLGTRQIGNLTSSTTALGRTQFSLRQYGLVGAVDTSQVTIGADLVSSDGTVAPLDAKIEFGWGEFADYASRESAISFFTSYSAEADIMQMRIVGHETRIRELVVVQDLITHNVEPRTRLGPSALTWFNAAGAVVFSTELATLKLVIDATREWLWTPEGVSHLPTGLPSAPADGDLWFDGTNFRFQEEGQSKTLGSGSSPGGSPLKFSATLYEVYCTPTGVLLTDVYAYKLIAPDLTVWNVTVDNSGILTTTVSSYGVGQPFVVVPGTDGSQWKLTVTNTGALFTEPWVA